ncbi:MAG: RNA-binding protein [Planctomycetota bacterium]|mgnify:CR=1 FL=1|nr:MAG: RNA-binding protein [Planctomycetota bacterium]
MNIYAGNLSHDVTDDDLREAFEAFGEVESVNVLKDRFTGESKGFGFVEIKSEEEAKAAIAAMDGKELKGRAIKVAEARPRSGSGPGRGGRRGGFGGGGRRGSFGGGGRGRDRRSY